MAGEKARRFYIPLQILFRIQLHKLRLSHRNIGSLRIGLGVSLVA